MAEGEDLTVNVPPITKQDTVNFRSKATVTSFMTLHLPSASVVGQRVLNNYQGDKMFRYTANLHGRTLGAILMMYAKVIKKRYPNYKQHERALLTNIPYGLTSEEAMKVYTETVENLLGKYQIEGYAFDDMMVVLCITSAMVNRSLLDQHHERSVELTEWLVDLLSISLDTYYDISHPGCPYWKALQDEKEQEFAAELAKITKLPVSKKKTLQTSPAAALGSAAAAAGAAPSTAGAASGYVPSKKRKSSDSKPAKKTVPATTPASAPVPVPLPLPAQAPVALPAQAPPPPPPQAPPQAPPQVPAQVPAPSPMLSSAAMLPPPPVPLALPAPAATGFQLSLMANVSLFGDEQLDLQYSFAMPNIDDDDDEDNYF